jgi:hypothetical protein
VSVFDVYTEPTTVEITSYDRGQQYDFDFSFLENSSIEVYEIIPVDGTDYRYLCPPQDYTITTFGRNNRYPVSRGGRVTFTRRHSAGATTVSIERNTLIDQTIDFPTVRPFNPRQIEIAADKATLIAQELAVRKCEADVGDLVLTQEVTITQYDDLKGSVINFMLDKLTAILLAIDQSATDCRATPDQT